MAYIRPAFGCRPVPNVGKADALWEETGKCTTETAGVGVQASKDSLDYPLLVKGTFPTLSGLMCQSQCLSPTVLLARWWRQPFALPS